MLQRERSRNVRLEIELEADALLSISGAQAFRLPSNASKEASSHEIARDWSVVAATVARRWVPLHPCSTPYWMNMKNKYVTKAAGGADVR